MIHIACLRDPYSISEAITKMIDDRINFNVDVDSNSSSDLLYKIRQHHIDLVLIMQDDDVDSLMETIVRIKNAHSHLPIAYIQFDRDRMKTEEIEKSGVKVFTTQLTTFHFFNSLETFVYSRSQVIKN